MKRLLLLLFLELSLALGTTNLKSQILDNSMFRIYRAQFIMGTVTQLRLNFDNTYELKIIEIDCSLCDHDELRNSINSSGNWMQKNDTLYLDQNKKLLIVEDSKIRPLFLLGLNTDSISKEQHKMLNQRTIDSHLNDFNLVYDTYQDGVAKLIIDKYRFRKEEYEIELKPNASIKDMRYYWDGKQRKKMK